MITITFQILGFHESAVVTPAFKLLYLMPNIV